ncbi:hypothetical protein EOM09_04450 [bacterium]|nr:hypothetical protein [bacterium]
MVEKIISGISFEANMRRLEYIVSKRDEQINLRNNLLESGSIILPMPNLKGFGDKNAKSPYKYYLEYFSASNSKKNLGIITSFKDEENRFYQINFENNFEFNFREGLEENIKWFGNNSCIRNIFVFEIGRIFSNNAFSLEENNLKDMIVSFYQIYLQDNINNHCGEHIYFDSNSKLIKTNL